MEHDYLAREAIVAGLLGSHHEPPEEDWENIALCQFIRKRTGEDYDPARGDEIIDNYVRLLMVEIRTQAVLVGLPDE